ncbi:MAG: DUF177 domain-containing protein [Defluviitaleaceae bacterium]|nr:DUF177 domain-containing protein [Defluviitaleaceae bacterium]
MYDIRKIGKNGIEVRQELDISIPHVFGAGEQTNVAFVGRLVNVGNHTFILEGEGSCVFATFCSRCLKPCENAIEFSVVENFVESGTIEPDYCDIVFDDENINIMPAIERNLYANIPYQFLCNEECAGLCIHCGTDLNRNNCDCNNKPTGVFADLLSEINTGGV